MNSFRKCIIGVTLIIVAGSALAMGDGKGMKENMPTFWDVDENDDGKITQQEFDLFHAERMKKMVAEGREMKHAGSMPIFADLDTNSDGGIDAKEFATHQAERRAEMQKKKAQSTNE